MNRDKFLFEMNQAGDAYVYSQTPVKGRDKYHICTLDFDNKYIQSKPTKNVKAAEGYIKIFSWDADNFKTLELAKITRVIPLNAIVRQNGR